MDLALSARDANFRDEVRRFLDEKLTPELRAVGRLMTSVYADYETTMAWHKALYEKDWVAPAWPVEYGGCDWSVSQHYIFASELPAAGAPALSPMGLGMCGPVLIGHGARLAHEAAFAAKMAEARVEILGLAFTEHRIMSALSHGEAPGAKSSLLKTRGTEISQRLTELALEAAAYYALPYQPHATRPSPGGGGGAGLRPAGGQCSAGRTRT